MKNDLTNKADARRARMADKVGDRTKSQKIKRDKKQKKEKEK